MFDPLCSGNTYICPLLKSRSANEPCPAPEIAPDTLPFPLRLGHRPSEGAAPEPVCCDGRRRRSLSRVRWWPWVLLRLGGPGSGRVKGKDPPRPAASARAASVVDAPMRNLVHGERVRRARVMANTEGDPGRPLAESDERHSRTPEPDRPDLKAQRARERNEEQPGACGRQVPRQGSTL